MLCSDSICSGYTLTADITTVRPHCSQCRPLEKLERFSLSVRPSVTFWCFVQMNEDMIVQFLASGRTIILISEKVKFIRMFAGDHPH